MSIPATCSPILLLLLALTLLVACTPYRPSTTADLQELQEYYQPSGGDFEAIKVDSTFLKMERIAGPERVPSPACLAVLPTGEVFVGVDMMGSLGKEPGKGHIIKLMDNDHDGVYEAHTQFAMADNPRGLMAVGDQLFVLHTVFDEGTDVAKGMDLVVFEDKDQDGMADGPSQPLIKNICSPAPLKDRGTDHATNGIRMGIDGWIYIAVGDFGFHEAEDRSGKKLSMLGGGIVRVRPDGTEMEIYAHGTRNIYDVAIDPFMNLYTRGNTNDGGGWNIRFIHYAQSGEYGYPTLFKHFTHEMLPALADLGGGSGTGSYFMDDDRWPAAYNHLPMMADWGRSELFIHRLSMDGPGFTQQEEPFISLPQITDIDLDGSGRMFLAAWDGAGYKGSPDKGFVVNVVPKGWTYEAFPDLKSLSVAELGELLKATRSVARFHAQQELLKRPAKEAAEVALAVAEDQALPLAARVAGIYTYAQLSCDDGVDALLKLSREDKLREFALRALTDRMPCLASVPLAPFLAAVKDANPRVQAAAIVGLGRLGKPEAAKALLEVEVPASASMPAAGTEGPHATPNSDIILPHLAVRSLVKLNAVEASVEALDHNPRLANWALQYLHDPRSVAGLKAAYQTEEDEPQKEAILHALARLYHREAPYDGSWWWGTRPDTHGPYYQAVAWEASEEIGDFLASVREQQGADKTFFASLNDRYRMDMPAWGTATSEVDLAESQVDLDAIKGQQGQVGKAFIEDVILAMAEVPGDATKGKALFSSQGCVACHSIAKGDVMKGPYMGQIGAIMKREQIAESILKPNASISQGFATVSIKTRDGKAHMGFVTAESAEELTLRDITGKATTLEKASISSREELETSMMPAGLVNALSYEEFASLLAYLEQQR